MRQPASFQRPLRREPRHVPDAGAERGATIAREQSQAQAMIDDRRAEFSEDKVSRKLGGSVFFADVLPAIIWPELRNHPQDIPPWTFERWYQSENAVVDRFFTMDEYNAADVEKRRAFCHAHGTKYAALGPQHTIIDYDGDDKHPPRLNDLDRQLREK